MNAIENKIRVIQSSNRRKVRAALDQAYASFAGQYPQWTQYLFDEHFLNSRIAPLLEMGLRPDIVTLVNAWADQMNWPKQEGRQETVADLTPAAAHFLRLLEAGLQVGQSVSMTIPQVA